MRSLLTRLLFSCALLCGLSTAVADTTRPTNVSTQTIVDKVTAAYGGDALLQADSIKVIDYNKGPWPGEGETPAIPELWRINDVLAADPYYQQLAQNYTGQQGQQWPFFLAA